MKKSIALMIPQLIGGGAERVVSNLSMALSDHKYQKHIIVQDTEVLDYPIKGELIDLKTKAYKNPFGKLINFLVRLKRLRKVKKKYKIDTTISFLEGPNLLNILTKGKDKVIVTVRNYVSLGPKDLYYKLYKRTIRWFYNKADMIVVVSEALKQDLVDSYGLKKDKIKVIYNFYDFDRINMLVNEEVEAEYKEIFNCPTIITAGRMTEEKGQWHLIRSFARVKKEIADAKLIVLGQGELEDYLKSLAADLGLERDVYFLGFKNNPFKYIAKSTIYVFPSLTEGFPNALCEAMVCGIPVISADCKSGPREILAPNTDVNFSARDIEHGEYGILVPVCDGVMHDANTPLTREEQILTSSIVSFISKQGLLEDYSRKALARVKDFTKDEIVKHWEELL